MKNNPEYSTVSKKFYVMTDGIVPAIRFTRSGGLSGTVADVKIEIGGFYFIGTEQELDTILKAEWDEFKHSHYKVLGIYEVDNTIIRLTRSDLTEKASATPYDKVNLFCFKPEKVNKQSIAKATEITFDDTNGARKDLIKKKAAEPQCSHAIIKENDTEWYCESGCKKTWSKEIYH
jgi:hypothetical protein